MMMTIQSQVGRVILSLEKPRKSETFRVERETVDTLTVRDRWADNRVDPIHKPIKEGQ